MFDSKKYAEIIEIIRKKKKKTQIIAISKNHSETQVRNAISKNVKIFGENRVQEAKTKFQDIKNLEKKIQLHLTGPLQRNKVKDALKIFDVFHTLDRENLLKEFSKYPELTKKKEFFIQVNTGKETSKSGVYPEKLKYFYNLCHAYSLKNIKGLMCIPPLKDDPKKHFKLLDDLARENGLNELSIGMSSDYLDAIEFNPAYIRLGTVLFGKRKT